jgi:NhaP-type Na+/H+ or K+/H+ antiporter
MEDPGVVYAAIGIATLLAAMLPRALTRLPISAPMVFLGAGVALFALVEPLPDPDLVGEDTALATHLTELCVVVALMGAGLALDRPAGWRSWMSTWRLLGITMPLCIVAMALIAGWLFGVGLAAAVLLAAVLAPTDPVLATEVQVGEPSDDAEEDEPRFALTSEAGLNDGLAFPFVHVAIALVTVGAAPAAWLGSWLAIDVVWRTVAGLLVGLGVGWLLQRLIFRSRVESLRLAEHAEGFVALAATFLSYGVAQLIAGYGFVAVFVCACVIRAGERSHGYHRVMHQFVDQAERLLTVAILVLLGGEIGRGLFADVGWREVAFAAALLLLVRPAAGWIGLVGGTTNHRERWVIAFFGVRGIGSIFYIAYALQAATFPEQNRLWATVALVVASSVVLHGVMATPVMRRLDRRSTR